MQVDFGFMVERSSFTWSTGQIDPLPEHAARAAALTASDLVCGDWLFPPLVNATNGQPPAGRLHPQVPARVFTIAPSHRLILSGGSQEVDFAPFLITFVGLLKGLRLIPEGWNHFYRVPLRSGALNDLLASDNSISKAIELATRFWTTNANQEIRQRMFSAMHWHLFGQLYEHEFERFNVQYTVLDTCYAVHRRLTGATGNPLHGERPGLLCAAYSLTVPAWAVRDSTGKFPIAELRNPLIHEGLYGGAPIGFASPTSMPMVELELTAFNTRLILALLGIQNDYTRSPVDTRQIYGFDLQLCSDGT